MKAIRIFLFVLIIIGIGLLLTQKIWVPKLVNQILLSEKIIPAPVATMKQNEITQEQALSMISNLSEVKNFITRVEKKHGDPHVAVNENTDNDELGTYWTVQVYENLSDHNSTFAWYQVYVNTGKVLNLSQ